MTRGQEIQTLITNPDFRTIAEKLTQGCQQLDDIMQDLAMYLLEMDDDRYAKIRNLKSYCISTIWQQYYSKTSPFYKKYMQKGKVVPMEDKRRTMGNWDNDQDEEDDTANTTTWDPETHYHDEEYNYEEDQLMEQALEIVEEMTAVQGTTDWYDAEILLSYIREGSYKKVSDNTGIHYRSVRNTVKETKQRIQEALKK